MDEKKQRISFSHIHYDLNPQVWTDPELGWDTSVYQYGQVILPVDKIWTPELHVTNG